MCILIWGLFNDVMCIWIIYADWSFARGSGETPQQRDAFREEAGLAPFGKIKHYMILHTVIFIVIDL